MKKQIEPRPSRTLSIRLPAVVIDALAKQKPAASSSVNSWLSEIIHDLIDVKALTKDERFEWALTSRPLPRAGRK